MPSVLTTREVIAFCKLSRSTILRLCQRGDFPHPIKIGLRKNGWLRADLESWLQSRREVAA